MIPAVALFLFLITLNISQWGQLPEKKKCISLFSDIGDFEDIGCFAFGAHLQNCQIVIELFRPSLFFEIQRLHKPDLDFNWIDSRAFWLCPVLDTWNRNVIGLRSWNPRRRYFCCKTPFKGEGGGIIDLWAEAPTLSLGNFSLHSLGLMQKTPASTIKILVIYVETQGLGSVISPLSSLLGYVCNGKPRGTN